MNETKDFISKLKELDDSAFEALGQAWFDENRRRNPLATEDDVHYAYHVSYYNDCDCLSQCACTGGVCNDCCPGCVAAKDCDQCYGSGLVSSESCKTCNGTRAYFIPDSSKKVEGYQDENGAWVAQRDNWRQPYDKCEAKELEELSKLRIDTFRPDSKMDYIEDGLLNYFQRVIKSLGGRLTRHPIHENYGGGDTLITYLPKYPQHESADDHQSRNQQLS